MQAAEAFKSKFGKELSPFQHQQLLELSKRHGPARVCNAITRMRSKVIDPVRAVVESIEKLTRRRCHQCSYTWDTALLGISICPRCRCDIVGSDGQIDPAKYEEYMHADAATRRTMRPELDGNPTKNNRGANSARANVIDSQSVAHDSPTAEISSR